ncbi:MAG: histidinol-phosphate transaminase [Rhodospirillaceae bacterium]|jgi:histidinol-phosphate aminotransferase|nr:histidinol-phosphate transaminase [Rhodospirillaceae bacterium]MBT5241983.1 histidinol-phosphate transaminase [Rhodospirillaceae bacterium]MBT5565708.1 histidinol-phosphate transaminase [Rhodospirillaceae bacterium]MBT6090783.1 histidinol-phosphate transaminase [Rhodospirillaceae bacterium]MBT6959660.1 histidinol-phosphate transaminase [Rhodospirillaceae bacterium]
MVLPQPRAGLMDIPLYEGGKSSLKGHDRVIKLSSNESALGPSPAAFKAYGETASGLVRYPDGNATDLKAAISEVHGLDPAQLICGAGSDEILCLACRAYAGPGGEVIHTAHGFLMYGIYARSVGATPVVVPETDLAADVDAILAAVTDATKLVFVANPNNPTGTVLSSADLARLRDALREDIVLVVDGAYAEFMDGSDYDGGRALAENTPNTLMTRTFSKIYGLASLRVGWAFGPRSMIETLERLRSPFNVNGAAIAVAAAAMRDVAHTDAARGHNNRWMGVAVQRLRALGLGVTGESGNFVLPEFPDTPGKSAADTDAFLQSKGVIVRRVDNYGLPNHLRITLGTDEEMESVLNALTQFMGGSDG